MSNCSLPQSRLFLLFSLCLHVHRDDESWFSLGFLRDRVTVSRCKCYTTFNCRMTYWKIFFHFHKYLWIAFSQIEATTIHSNRDCRRSDFNRRRISGSQEMPSIHSTTFLLHFPCRTAPRAISILILRELDILRRWTLTIFQLFRLFSHLADLRFVDGSSR